MFEGFEGTLVSVHVNPESIREIEAMGIRNYRHIGEVPGPVDYVVVNTPRRFAVDTFAETALCAQGDKRRFGGLPVALFERRLDSPSTASSARRGD